MPRRRHVCHVCHAGLGCRADFILASRAVRPRAAAVRHADGVGAFSSGGVRSARHVLVWDAVSRSGAFPALSEVSESLGSDRTRPRALAQASTGRDPGASESSESLYPGHACLGPPEGPARVIRGRKGRSGPAHPSRRTRWGKLRRGARQAVCRLHPPHPARRRGCPARLAGRSITEGGCVGAKLN